MGNKARAVEFRAEVRQLRTMTDGTINLVLNLPEDCREQCKVMLDWSGLEVRGVLQVLTPMQMSIDDVLEDEPDEEAP